MSNNAYLCSVGIFKVRNPKKLAGILTLLKIKIPNSLSLYLFAEACKTTKILNANGPVSDIKAFFPFFLATQPLINVFMATATGYIYNMLIGRHVIRTVAEK